MLLTRICRPVCIRQSHLVYQQITSCTVNIWQVEAAQTSAKTLLELEAEAKAYTAALEAVRNQYVPCERTTNFKKDLEQHAKRLVPTFRSDCNTTPR